MPRLELDAKTRFAVVDPVADESGFYSGAVDSKPPDYFEAPALSRFVKVAEVLAGFDVVIPPDWTVGDMFAFLAISYARALDTQTPGKPGIEETAKVTFFHPPNSKGPSNLEFSIESGTATYNGRMLIGDDGLPLTVSKSINNPFKCGADMSGRPVFVGYFPDKPTTLADLFGGTAPSSEQALERTMSIAFGGERMLVAA